MAQKKVKVFISFKTTVSIDESLQMDSIAFALKLTSINRNIKIGETTIWDCKPDKN